MGRIYCRAKEESSYLHFCHMAIQPTWLYTFSTLGIYTIYYKHLMSETRPASVAGRTANVAGRTANVAVNVISVYCVLRRNFVNVKLSIVPGNNIGV